MRLPTGCRGWRWSLATLGMAVIAAPALAGGWPPPADVTAWIGTASSDAVRMAEMGDLSGRGTNDWAGVVRRASFDAGAEPLGGWQVIVFLQQPDGHYRPAAQSAPFSFDCGTSRCWMETMRIDRRSVFIEAISHWHSQFDHVTYQFKARDGGWPLIGVVEDSSGDPDDGGPSWQETIDFNRLTHRVVVTCQVDGKPARVTRHRLVVPQQDLTDFDQFFSGMDDGIQGRCRRG